MEKYYDKPMSKDWQPSNKEFAGKQFGTANKYLERTEKKMNKDAGKIRSQSHKGRYD